jgi:uncharacterized membrane protein YbhN (UPF0104 family)
MSKSAQRKGLWEKLMPQDMEKRMRSHFPSAFLTIGIAIGMVVMVILFYFYESVIKSWAGFSPLAFLLLLIYTGIACFILGQYRKSLAETLNRKNSDEASTSK